jgi:membrane associated rhomboid family serine protease
VLVLASLIVTLGAKADLWEVHRLLLTFDTTDEYYRTVTTLFIYGSTGYEIVALGAVFLFGWLLERRHGAWAPLLVFLAGGAAGMFLAIAGDDVGIVTSGGNSAALALLAAWSMRDILGRRRGEEDDSDLLGVLAIAAVLILLPLATDEASALAGLGGGLAGIVLGVLLARLPER